MTTETITSLAAAKRAMKPGSVWRFDAPHWFTGEREVISASSVGARLTVPADATQRTGPGYSNMRWPAASKMEFHGDGFTIKDLGGREMTYTLVRPA